MWSRTAVAFALLALSLSSPAARAQEDFFPMAVWYGGGKARAPMLEKDPASKKDAWRADLRQIKALGFNTVRCWIDWATGQPAPDRYDFETIDVILQLAEEVGLKVVIQAYMDSAPAWVGRRYPDALFVSSNGEAIRPEAAPGYCFDHPGVREAELAFFRALAERAAKSPAFLGWDLWSEPHVINWATPTYIAHPEFCFCPNTIRRFRGWLEKKYGTLERLNGAWYRQFASWDEVEPGRLSTILSYTDYIDWKTFIADKLGEDLRARYEAVKAGAPRSVATNTVSPHTTGELFPGSGAGVFTEQDEPRPHDAYSASKREAEEVLRAVQLEELLDPHPALEKLLVWRGGCRGRRVPTPRCRTA